MKLTDAEREELGYRISGETGLSNLVGQAIAGALVPDIESLVAARLEQQREALAAAIEELAGDHSSSLRANARRACYLNATRIVREYQPGEDT